MIKKGLHYVKKMKELTKSQVNNIKEKLIEFKNELIMKNKINNRIKEGADNYNNSIVYNGIKDIRYLFNEDEDVDVYEVKITYKESPFK